jgi:two-component system, LytTR family, response regulator LytT
MSERGSATTARLQALVVEDEWPAREYLVELLLATRQVEVVAAVAGAAEAREALGPGGIEVDVAFVDINLVSSGGDEAGLQLVRELAGSKGAPLFVMATALRQHAAEAFDLDVVDYLLKPFSEERVGECVARIARRRARRNTPTPVRVVARSKRGLVFLQQSEVWAFEASERLSYVHSRGGRFDVDLSLAAIEASLGAGWLRVHRNWVVNQEHVKALERDELGSTLVLGGVVGAEAGDLRVPIARDKVQVVRDALLVGTTGIRR